MPGRSRPPIWRLRRGLSKALDCGPPRALSGHARAVPQPGTAGQRDCLISPDPSCRAERSVAEWRRGISGSHGQEIPRLRGFRFTPAAALGMALSGQLPPCNCCPQPGGNPGGRHLGRVRPEPASPRRWKAPGWMASPTRTLLPSSTSTKNALSGHHTIAGLVVDGAAIMADLAGLGHPRRRLAQPEPRAHRQVHQAQSCGGDVLGKNDQARLSPQAWPGLDSQPPPCYNRPSS